ncbi:hypothetical protein [Thermosipho africanus]|uniref:hypothetical protein n=1 Tax=Thermosipho africanus TaxID=2421 RepID=UPI0009DA6274
MNCSFLSEGLIIIDVSDPLNLSINDVVKTIPTYYAAEVYVDNNYAYIADYDNGIVIFDIQDPENAFIKKDMLYMYFYGCTGF